MTAFAERLYRAKKKGTGVLHVFVDEASVFCPQRVEGAIAKMVGAMEAIVRRGRIKGIGCTLIDQRPASVNKNVLTQAKGLIVLGISAPTDRKAITLWIDTRGADEAKAVVDELPSMGVGEAWVWFPDLDLVEKVQVRQRETFDSSAAGQMATAATTIAEQLKATTARQDEVMAKIDEVARTPHRPSPRPVPASRPAPQAKAPRKDGNGDNAADASALTNPQQRVLDAVAWWESVGFARPTKIQVGFVAGYRVGKKVGGTFGNILGQLRAAGLINYPSQGTVSLTEAGSKVATPLDIPATESDLQGAFFAQLKEPERRVLSVLVECYPEEISKIELGERSGYTVTEKVGGTFGNILGRLRSLGLIEYPRQGVVVALPVLFLEEAA